jgi:predicted site-specific integrase-resolvase
MREETGMMQDTNIYVDLPQKTLYRVDEVAKFFGVTTKTIYRWRVEGLLSGCKITNKSLRIFRQSILQLISKQ